MRHITVVESEQIAHIGRRHRFRCRSCGSHSPWMSKDAAELARERHAWENAEPGRES